MQLLGLLSVGVGVVVFTTIHKFFPEKKGDRHPTLRPPQLLVIADELRNAIPPVEFCQR